MEKKTQREIERKLRRTKLFYKRIFTNYLMITLSVFSGLLLFYIFTVLILGW